MRRVEPAAVRRRAFAALLLALTSLGCGALQPVVERRVDGVTTEGRFIEPDAYALYALAALREARGEWQPALALYERAFDLDDRGPELRTRIGAMACKLRRDKQANRAFAAAARADAAYGPLWFELATCRKARGDLPGAERAALEAVRLDPERWEASLLAADLAELRGDSEGAWRLRDGAQTHAPDVPALQQSLLTTAERAHDKVRAERARVALRELRLPKAPLQAPSGIARALLALEQGDLAEAAKECRVLLTADPENGEALVVALAIADLRQDEAELEALLARLGANASQASPRLLKLLSELLSRRLGGEAEQLVRAAAGG